MPLMRTNRALHPLVDQRDILSVAQTNLSDSLRSTLKALTVAQIENMICVQKNRELTTTLFDLAHQLESQDAEDIQNPELRSELEAAHADLKESRKRRQIMKSVVAAIIAGSGSDWARDDVLRGLVLDNED